MPLAGETIIAGKIPGERIATTVATTNTAAISTTETVTDTVVAAVVAGRTYQVVADLGYDLSVGDDQFTVRIREDSVAGNQIGSRTLSNSQTGGNQDAHFEAEYTADVTENKTFVLTLIRASGTGNIIRNGAATSPTFLYVNYIRG